MNKRVLIALAAMVTAVSALADTIPAFYERPLQWQAGASLGGAWVPPTNRFLGGNNTEFRRIGGAMSATVNGAVAFDPSTREGRLFPGLYQGLGATVNTFFASELLGTPVSVYVMQGAPIARFNDRLWLGYEWQFGAAFGWNHYDEYFAPDNAVVSTSVTAHMAVALKLNYRLTDRLQLAFGLEGRHFSNGNTSWPNSGANTVGAMVGVTCDITPRPASAPRNAALEAEADSGRWFYDITAYGAWRKRSVMPAGQSKAEMCPGRFGVVGLQFAPMRTLNRWVAVGPALDVMWDESAGLAPYWVEGTYGQLMRFYRPPLWRQMSVGVSAHAELTTPIFAINAGIGYDFLKPRGDKAFFQSLTIKAFVTRRLFLNVGYRLGNFKDPQNLMLGVGVRL